MVLIEGEKNVAEFNNGNPSTYKEDANRKGKADDCYAEFERKENLSKGQLHYELDQWPRRCKAQVRLTIIH
jgi:hypothetical protein